MEERKFHYKMYKDGKKIVFAAIATFSILVAGGLSTVEVHADTVSENTSTATASSTSDMKSAAPSTATTAASRPVSADVIAASTSSSAVKAETTSASSSSAVKADATSDSSSSAVKADATSDSSSSAVKADTTSASSSSAVKADTTSASSSSAMKADATSDSSSSAVKADTTNASSSSAMKADATSASSSSAMKADATSDSSSSAVKADTTNASSSSAVKADTTNASSSSAVKADNSSYQTGSDTGVNKLPAVVSKIDSVTDQTIKGVDLTSYQAEIAAGVKFYDFNGGLLDGNGLMKLLKNNGVNYVNLKVAVNPFDANGNTYGQGQPTLQNAIKTAVLAQNDGLKVNFTLLFSDAYTSDDVQKAPKNWPSDNEKLHSQVTAYIDDVISQFNNNKVLPNMITVGNQINYKFIDKTDWPTITMLLKSVTDDIHEKLPTTLIGIGLGKPNSYWSTPIWQLNNAGIHYDEVVANINPAWNSMDDIAAAKNVVLSAGKKFTVGSVTYPFTDQDSDGKQNDSLASDILSKNVGTISPQGQATYLQNLFKTITSDNNNSDAGVFYGDATWIAVKPGSSVGYQANKDASNSFGTGWASQYASGYIDGADQYWGGNTQDNQALFDDLGKPLQTLTIFKQISDANNSNTTPNDDPNAAQKDPYEFGGDTGLKDQKVVINKISSMTNQAIRGVDVSSYQSLKDAGVKFYDYNGNEESLMKVLADQGVNYIRIRIWNDPKSASGKYYGGGNNDVAQDLKIAEEANKYGMKILLDF
ncbi:glycosyl hydrolase 53 family protein, partial [Leuconostoc citreum]